MKILMALGGMIGFLIGVMFGRLQDCGWPTVLWRSCAAALAAGLLLRWWGRVWINGLKQAQQAKLAQMAKVQKEKPAAAASK